MFNLLTYSGIVTKTKAMGAQLISRKDYEDIANLTSVTDFINFLKTKPAYQELFASLDERLLHRNEIEHVLTSSLYHEYSKLFRFANTRQRKAFEPLYFRYEVNILKRCLRNVFTKDNRYDLSVFESFFLKHSGLSVHELSNSSSMEEFVNHLKGTRYYQFLHTIQQRGDASLYEYEVQLDIFYFLSLWKNKKKYSKSRDLKVFVDIIGQQIDYLNILWIYRSKKYYAVDTSHIYSSIIPIRYNLSAQQISSMVEAPSLEEFVLALEKTHYSSGDVDTSSPNFSVENLLYNSLYRLYRSNQQKDPVSMCTIFNYLFLKELEIDRLTTALECVRYGLDSSYALNYILK